MGRTDPSLTSPKISGWPFPSRDGTTRVGARAGSTGVYRSGKLHIVTDRHFFRFCLGFSCVSLDFFMLGRSALVVPYHATYFLPVSSDLQSSQAFPSPKEIGNPAVVAQQSVNDASSGSHDLCRDQDQAMQEAAELHFEDFVSAFNLG